MSEFRIKIIDHGAEASTERYHIDITGPTLALGLWSDTVRLESWKQGQPDGWVQSWPGPAEREGDKK